MSAKVILIPTKLWSLFIKAAILFGVCLLIGFLMNFLSPRVTLTMEPEERFWFWIYLCLIGGAGVFICDLFLTILKEKWPSHLKGLAQSICGTTAVLIPLYSLYDPADLPGFGTVFMFVWVVMVLILIVWFILNLKLLTLETVQGAALELPEVTPKSDVAQVPDVQDIIDMPKPVVERPAQILGRLPVHLQGAELYAISAEDHYVRVHTSKGGDMILMRLSDALLETGSVEGVQIHRSWWVAKTAIEDIKSKGRAAEVTLKNNVKAPVSRNMLKTLKTMGWL
ncbi:MAG: LytTR family DNA-binding domain-containing protein [Hellea sp.]